MNVLEIAKREALSQELIADNPNVTVTGDGDIIHE